MARRLALSYLKSKNQMENSTVLVETLNIKILPTIFLRISKLRKERNKQAMAELCQAQDKFNYIQIL